MKSKEAENDENLKRVPRSAELCTCTLNEIVCVHNNC